MKDKALWFFAIVVILLTLGLCFNADAQTTIGWSAGTEVRTAATQATEADIKVTAVVGGGGAYQSGSGTAVAHHNNGTVILTNHHVIEGATSYRCCLSGSCYPAKLLGSDSKADVALLWVPKRIRVVEIGSSVPDGQIAQFRAFDGGQHFRVWQGRIIGYQYDSYIADTYSVGGNSGGGVYVNGKLVGVLWGNRDGKLAFAGVGPIRKLLGRVGVGIAAPFPERIVPVPTPAPKPKPNTPPPVCESCNCDERISKLVDLQADLVIKVQSLEQKVNDIPVGERGPVGPAGPQGPQGARGPAGKDADTADLELRITALESQLAEVRATTPVSWDIVPRKE